jgi:hypothetical protein
VLHDIAVGPFAEQPAGKIATPFIVGGAAHVELHEGAGFLHIFPWRGGFAGLQADDRIPRAQRLAGLHFEFSGDAIALVEQADHRLPLVHRCAGERRGFGIADLLPFYADRAGAIFRRHVVAAAPCQQHRQGEDRISQNRQDPSRRTPDHDASGLHAS